MDVRQKMVANRERMGLTVEDMSAKCHVSKRLLRLVEKGEVTVPGLALMIAKAYKITARQAEELMPINRRVHGGDYDPDRFVVKRSNTFAIRKYYPDQSSKKAI